MEEMTHSSLVVFLVSDCETTHKKVGDLLEEALDCNDCCTIKRLNRKEYNEENKDSSNVRAIFAFPVKQRILVYDKDDPRTTFQEEMDDISLEKSTDEELFDQRYSPNMCSVVCEPNVPTTSYHMLICVQ